MKKLFVGVACLCLLLVATTAKANVMFDETLNYDFNGPKHSDATTTNTYWMSVGTFDFDLHGQSIVSATLSGLWGNSVASTTAGHYLWLDPVFDGGVYVPGSGTYVGSNPYAEDGPGSWTFDLTDFSDLLDGSATFWVEQFTPNWVRLGHPTTLHIEAVPVPAAIWLLGSGLLGLVGLRRKFTS